MMCFGLLVIFHCNVPPPVAVSEFCQLAAPDVVRLRALTATELAALTRPRKEAILSLRLKYKKLCA